MPARETADCREATRRAAVEHEALLAQRAQLRQQKLVPRLRHAVPYPSNGETGETLQVQEGKPGRTGRTGPVRGERAEQAKQRGHVRIVQVALYSSAKRPGKTDQRETGEASAAVIRHVAAENRGNQVKRPAAEIHVLQHDFLHGVHAVRHGQAEIQLQTRVRNRLYARSESLCITANLEIAQRTGLDALLEPLYDGLLPAGHERGLRSAGHKVNEIVLVEVDGEQRGGDVRAEAAV